MNNFLKALYRLFENFLRIKSIRERKALEKNVAKAGLFLLCECVFFQANWFVPVSFNSPIMLASVSVTTECLKYLPSAKVSQWFAKSFECGDSETLSAMPRHVLTKEVNKTLSFILEMCVLWFIE